jgi:ACS family glucarate transporter-like MFS transporter
VKVRWHIFLFLFGFAILSYLQRTSLGVAAQNIMPDLHLSQVQIGWLNAAFATCYAIAQLPGGVLGQKYGARLTYIFVGIVGIVATIATPLAPVLLTGTALFLALLAAQGLLGLSQGPVFPMTAAVAQTWFPQRQWAVTNGLFSLGMNIGGAMTAPLIVVLTGYFGWQGALLWIALPAAVLTAAWAWYGRDTPKLHWKVKPAELADLEASDMEKPAPMTLARMGAILRQRDVQLLAFSYMCFNYVFYLIGTWSFLYLVQARNFTGLESGFAGMLPWIGAGIGAGIGGYLSDGLATRIGYRWGYRVVPLVTLPLAGLLLLVTIGVSTPYAAVLALMATFFMVEINEGAYWAATMRVARADTGAATGVLNTGGNMGGIISAPVIGALSGAGDWNTTFIIGTVFALIATACWLVIDPDRRVATAAPARIAEGTAA